MLALFREKAPQAKVLLITPPATDESVGNWGRTNNATGEYAKACVEVAREGGVEVLDLHTLFNALPEAQWKGMLMDGLHFNQLGNEYMEQQLVDTIRTKFPDLQKQLDQPEFPYNWLATLPPPVTQQPPPWQQQPPHQGPPHGSRMLMGVLSGTGTQGGVDAASFFAVPVVVACAVLVGIAAVIGKRRVRAKQSVAGP
jgi:hypothetical protein